MEFNVLTFSYILITRQNSNDIVKSRFSVLTRFYSSAAQSPWSNYRPHLDHGWFKKSKLNMLRIRMKSVVLKDDVEAVFLVDIVPQEGSTKAVPY